TLLLSLCFTSPSRRRLYLSLSLPHSSTPRQIRREARDRLRGAARAPYGARQGFRTGVIPGDVAHVARHGRDRPGPMAARSPRGDRPGR
ncbi:unnamed protein product, partial [Urochloa humidicola]